VKTRVTGFWITTVLLAFGVGSDGAAELAHPGNNGGLVHLGYPVSFVTLIGFSKVLGAVAGFPALRDGSNGPMLAFSAPDGRDSIALAFGRRVLACGCDPRLGNLDGCFLGAGTARPYGWSPVSATEKSCIVKGAGVEYNQAVP
jgi:hypothetical protein